MGDSDRGAGAIGHAATARAGRHALRGELTVDSGQRKARMGIFGGAATGTKAKWRSQ